MLLLWLSQLDSKWHKLLPAVLLFNLNQRYDITFYFERMHNMFILIQYYRTTRQLRGVFEVNIFKYIYIFFHPQRPKTYTIEWKYWHILCIIFISMDVYMLNVLEWIIMINRIQTWIDFILRVSNFGRTTHLHAL